MRTDWPAVLLLVVLLLLLPSAVPANDALAIDSAVRHVAPWTVTLINSHGPPCPQASLLLELQDGDGDVVAVHDVLLEFGLTGVTEEPWNPGPLPAGDYQLVVLETPCRDDVPAGASLPVRIDSGEQNRAVQMISMGNGPNWHLHYVGTTHESLADDVLALESSDPVRLRNVSGRSLRPCRRRLGGRAMVMERFETGWRQAGRLDFPSQRGSIAAGDLVEMVSAPFEIVEAPPRGEVVEARMLRLSIEPERDSFAYDADQPGSSRRPFPGVCDTLLVRLPVNRSDGAGRI